LLVDDLQDGAHNGLELKNGTCKATVIVGDKTVSLCDMLI